MSMTLLMINLKCLKSIVMVDSDGETYQTFFGNVETDDDNLNQGIGTITTLVDGTNYNMVYVPPPLTNVIVKTLVTSATHKLRWC